MKKNLLLNATSKGCERLFDDDLNNFIEDTIDQNIN